ncbi:MAG TPA: NAD-dependent succinate-semialdehyde dehydrogenase [Casimicrobiaceae bacterium]|jgi:succinate-semialdehyde dehydrogenase/glutarate-semialdehyde dehydrogenase|nr:NAD-dependent succinate-semialdehyde dehydrogenase [Casimicrobiaceae bacterium]
MSIQAINPASGDVVGTYDEMAPQDVAGIIEATHAAFTGWRHASYAERAAPMRRAAEILRRDARDLAQLMAREMGKPVRDGVAEANKCASVCDYFADNAEKFLARETVATEARASFVAFNPLGVVLAVMPWNFPFWQVFRFAAPGLMAGNAAVLKHASNVPGCALAIERVFERAGFPKNLFRTLMIGSKAVDAVIEHSRVRAVTLTGSGPAGSAVAAKAGQLLKKTVLELGGSDPYLILEDADLDVAAEVCTKARLVNSGQSCIAGKRFIVVEAVRADFERRFVARMAAAKMGDPQDESTQIGPQARRDLRDTLQRQVDASRANGARCLLGGAIPDGPGAFYPPSVLTGVHPGMPAFDEELFGPVAAIVPVRDEAQAVMLANASAFGLGGGVITRDVARGERIAADLIESGCVFVNDAVRSDPRLPFGGIKDSGYGRELASFGIREFVNVKTVVVA